MLDIVQMEDGTDLRFADTPVTRASNVISTQLGSLEYARDFGVDLRFFLTEQMSFQNESFKSYLVERLAYHQVNTTEIREELDSLFNEFIISVQEPIDSTGRFIQ